MRKTNTVENRATAEKPFADAERITYLGNDGQPVTFVVMAVMTAVGNDFALVCTEDDIRPEAVMAFEYHTDEDGTASLAPIETEDLYEDVLHLFADLFVADDEN